MLQWISWDYFGKITVSNNNGYAHIFGGQRERGDPGALSIDGDVTMIDSTQFLLDGRIVIIHAPSGEPDCIRNGKFQFLITKNRKYWRLQQMTCQNRSVTDYVDIFF